MDATRSHARAALAALLLVALPVSGSAQQKGRPAATPAPKAAAAPAVAPEPAAPPPEPLVAWRVALAAGYEKESDPELAGPRLQLEVERDLLSLGARGQLSFVAAVAWFHGTHRETLGSAPLTLTTDTTAELVEAVPAFRAGYALSPRLRLFAEVGVGGAWIRSKEEKSLSGSAIAPALEEDTFAGVLRLGAGGSWQVSDRLRIGLQVPLTRRYGEVTSQTFSVAATAAYEL